LTRPATGQSQRYLEPKPGCGNSPVKWIDFDELDLVLWSDEDGRDFEVVSE